jgi:hypothetical protein
MIIDIGREAADASRANKHLQARYLHDRMYAIQRRLALDFGALHGWRLSDSHFGIEALARGGVSGGEDWWCEPPRPYFDHCYYYRVNRRAAAIVAHLYDYDDVECRAFAVSNRLTIEQQGDYPSWWFPGFTTLVVYAGPVGLAAEIAHFEATRAGSAPPP